MTPGGIAPPHLLYRGENQVNSGIQQIVTAIGFNVIPLDGEAWFRLPSTVDTQTVFSTSTPAFFGFVSDDPPLGFFVDHFQCPSRPFTACAFQIDNLAVRTVPDAGSAALLLAIVGGADRRASRDACATPMK